MFNCQLFLANEKLFELGRYFFIKVGNFVYVAVIEIIVVLKFQTHPNNLMLFCLPRNCSLVTLVQLLFLFVRQLFSYTCWILQTPFLYWIFKKFYKFYFNFFQFKGCMYLFDIYLFTVWNGSCIVYIMSSIACCRLSYRYA